MKGLELSRRFYEECGRPILEEQFSHLLPYLAVGLSGSGSDCFGYDDDLSRDHDFEPAFCIFLPDESIVDRKSAFALERAYAKLPKEFLGVRRNKMSAVGGDRHGVIRMSEFFEARTGSSDGKLSLGQWFSLPEQALLEAVNGEVFFDHYGEFTQIRERISYFPEDVRLKKLAGNLLLMGQAGEYNYGRCIRRGETAAAQLAMYEFVKSAMNAAYLLEKRYMPYYKWSFRGLREFSKKGERLAGMLEFLISSDNCEDTAEKKSEMIEAVCKMIIDELQGQQLTNCAATEMERQAYVVNDRIADGQIRNLHILSAV